MSDGTRAAADLPRRRAGRRQDLRHARRGAAAVRARHRRRRRLRRDPRPGHDRGSCSRARDRARASSCAYRGATFTEMDLDAVLARTPEVALVDELAHTNVPGSAATPSAGRTSTSCWTPASTSSPPSTSSTWSRSTTWSRRSPGCRSARPCPTRSSAAPTRSSWSTCPPRRCAGGWRTATSTPPTRSTPRSRNYFRAGNLTALRELALLWLADRVDEGLQDYRQQHGIAGTWEARERVVVALTGGPEGDTLIRRAARIAARSAGGDLLAVHVAPVRRPHRRRPAAAGRAAPARRGRSAAPTTRSSATTSRTPCSTSPGPRTPPSWCSAPAGGHGWRRRSAARASARPPSATPATSTCTS